MIAYVNENCIGCGLCVSTCPEIFKMNDASIAEAASTSLTGEVLARAEEAKDGCPVNAIEIND